MVCPVCTGIAVKTGAAALTTSLSAMAAMAKRPIGGRRDVRPKPQRPKPKPKPRAPQSKRP